MYPLLIHKDDTKCIFDYDSIMHVRRFMSLKTLFIEHMPNVEEIHYNCSLTTSREFLPDKEDFPNVEFTYVHTALNKGTIEMLKLIPYDKPTILVVELSQKESLLSPIVIDLPE